MPVTFALFSSLISDLVGASAPTLLSCQLMSTPAVSQGRSWGWTGWGGAVPLSPLPLAVPLSPLPLASIPSSLQTYSPQLHKRWASLTLIRALK